jgi:hypothetical protein
MTRTITLLAAACWLLSAVQVAEAASYPASLRSDHILLGLLSLAGLAACAARLASWRYGRAAVAATAALYLVLYCMRTWTMQIEPQMAFMGVSMLDATLSFVRIVHFSIAHSFGLGNLLLAADQLFFEWLMPLGQAAVLAATATGANSLPAAASPPE